MDAPREPQQTIQIFRATPTRCPYIAGRIERKLVVLLGRTMGRDLHSQLTRAGFRRNQNIAYRPDCQICHACIPVRLDASRLNPSRNQRRVLAANADLRIAHVPPVATPEQYDLFMRYQAERHADGDMGRMSYDEYAEMVETGVEGTMLMEARDGDGTLRGVLLYDQLTDGASAVYSFFDPCRAAQSMGTFLVLRLAADVRAAGCRFVYLGYWIKESRKMAYKARFHPLEQLTANGWQPVPET